MVVLPAKFCMCCWGGSVVTSAAGAGLAVPISPGLGKSQPGCGGSVEMGAAAAFAGSRLKANREVLVGRLLALCAISHAAELKLISAELKP